MLALLRAPLAPVALAILVSGAHATDITACGATVAARDAVSTCAASAAVSG